MSYANIRFEVADGIARLTLNRPERRNRFNAAMHAELRAAIGSVRVYAFLRVVLLTEPSSRFGARPDLREQPLCTGTRRAHTPQPTHTQ